MKKYIFTESQIKKVIDSVITEQSNKSTGKFPFAFDNSSTDFQGEIKNNFLYITLESDYMGYTTFKAGPIIKMPKKTAGTVTITKKNGNESVTLVGEPIIFTQSYTVKPVKF